MKAIVITTPGGPEVLQWQERPRPVPGEGQVLVKVHAAGINRPDVFQRKGNYPPPPGVPADIPGLEIAGEVVELGAGVQRWQVGDRVCALVGGGGYAEYVIVHAEHCLPVPAGWNFAAAASLPETMFTVWHNVFQRGRLQAGEHFLVHGGSSGIGITAIQLAKAFGAIVFATAGNDDKCYVCEQLGATQCINYRTADFAAVLADKGIDVILDMVGGDYIPKNIRLLSPDGRLVFINAMEGGLIELDMLYIMRQRLTITGSTLRNRDIAFKAGVAAALEAEVWPLLDKGVIKPVIYKTFSIAEAAAAHQLMESSQHIGKIVLTID
ncbi:NAD(P)H-quinone oxidoreductase [Chitinophaga pendula]|uniref:NAD(P)H-quinone oxidoreductase n=1 Tax=Chitinophaga TaxID=79328 RepID=UPI000BB097AD|nr:MULTISPECIES: NAD(P)H-quinone oxidoreductase [Chitinophaga]ASZ10364.1 zinc-binding dehydrogenase [Chitinophaga sp. MD30]UCJ06671.1 NAD(P)H-quinone oxidoreductase [Chitinophaga pendula]